MITDEIVWKACDTFLLDYEPPLSRRMRAALEAIAPMLQKALTDADICRAKAQGMREAAKICNAFAFSITAEGIDPSKITMAIWERAQELDPQ